MKYEASTQLSNKKFKRLIGVEQEVFNKMIACLEQEKRAVHQREAENLKLICPIY